MIPSPLDCEILDWFSRRPATRWSLIPAHWRPRVHELVGERGRAEWLERVDVRLVRITPVGRLIASAYRHGRAALAPGQRELVG